MSLFCKFAYNGFFYNKGFVSQCCLQDKLFDKTDWSDVTDLDEFCNSSPEFSEIRKALAAGIKHPACQTCWNDESIYGSSMRISNSTFNDNVKTNKNTIKFVDFRLNNKCNLQCRMCQPSDSDQLERLANELLYEGILNPLSDKVLKNHEWPTDSQTILNLVLNLPDLESLRFAGGEPFLMPEIENFLTNLIKLKKTDLYIEFITNCTSIKSKVISLLENFKRVRISCSIDGVGKTIEYQRYPVKWSTVEQNFLRLYEKNIFELSLVPCVGILNYLTLDEFFKWSNQFSNISIGYNEIYDPSFFNFRYIPQKVREPFYERFSSIELKNVDLKWKNFQKSIMFETLTPTQDECNLLYRYVKTVWDRKGKYKFLDLYPWADEIIQRANKNEI